MAISVITGNIGANTSLSRTRPRDRDDADDKLVEVIVGEKVKMLQPGSKVVGDSVWLRNGSSVYNVHYNKLINKGTILGTKTTPLGLPVLSLPALPNINPGSQDKTVRKEEKLTLGAGAYKKITVMHGGTLILTGGAYHVSSLDIRTDAIVLFEAPANVLVKNEMDTDAKTYIGPDPILPSLKASDIIFYVEGADDKGRRHDDDEGSDEEVSPTSVQIGVKNTIYANIYAPNGTVWLKTSTKGTGAFIGKRVRIGEKAELKLESAF